MAKKSSIGEWLEIDRVKKWDKNPRRNANAVEPVAQSIKRFGFVAPIVIWTSRERIVAGHTRFDAMQRNLREDPAFVPPGAPGVGLVPVRMHEFANEAEANAYALLDNRLNEIAEWDTEALGVAMREIIDLSGSVDMSGINIGWSMDELNEFIGDTDAPAETTTYTSKIKAPIYTPKGDRPPVAALYDRTKTEALLAEIDKAKGLTAEQSSFLRLAAERHTAFNFHQIAEWYCHASPEVQRLMENSGLVIIDFNRAIELGYVKLTTELAKLADKEEGKVASSYGSEK